MDVKKKVNNEPTTIEPQEIRKPVAVLQVELEEKIVKAIDESGLHISLIYAYFKEFTENLARTAEETRRAEISQYNAQVQALSNK